ncbi:hypothetical protein Sango_1282000 [Sesamum angolense]|uniref:Reverse transcriptase Ty1/copia-type domain-containing protein n=1 Tax=Sesamum angolense TaxID=2727404 RepID=A0AAE1WRA7_9LAMI|nr:hypothetical protein Sango_1282000 [Sesamum angolense]
MKDIGEADVILGIKLIRSTDGISISQSHYVEKIIEKFGYQTSRIAKTPYDSSIALFKNKSGVLVAQLNWLDTLVVLTKPIRVLWITKVPEGHGVTGPDSLLFLRDIVMLAELCALDTIGTEAE